MFHDKIICQRLSLRVRNRTVTGQLMGRRREMWTVHRCVVSGGSPAGGTVVSPVPALK